jgi:hypothetical protein
VSFLATHFVNEHSAATGKESFQFILYRGKKMGSFFSEETVGGGATPQPSLCGATVKGFSLF